MDDATENAWQRFIARPCTVPNYEATLSGFQTEADAREVWHGVEGLLNVFGRTMNLVRLHRVTIAYDYAGTLAQIDQGTGTGNIVKPTNDEFATGVAMAVPILVDGKPLIHLVGNAALFAALRDKDTNQCAIARYILAHECGHIHDLDVQDKAFPGFLLKARVAGRKAVLFQMASACWSEYIACRLSAIWASEEQTDWFEDTFCSSLEGVRARGNAAIRLYSTEGDIERLLNCIVAEYGNVMKYGSYLLGHIAGLELEFSDTANKAVEMIDSQKFFKGIFWRLKDRLEEMWKGYQNWNGPEVFESLEALSDEMLRIAGIHLETTPKGLYVRVPFNGEIWSDLAGA